MDNDFSGYPGVAAKQGRVAGKLTLGKSRVPAEQVADELDHGETPEDIAYNHDLNLSDVLKFKAYRDSRKPAAVQS